MGRIRTTTMLLGLLFLAGCAIAWPWGEGHPQAAAAPRGPSEWAADDIREAAAHQLMPSWVSGRYGNKITREQFAELAVLLYESLTDQRLNDPVANPFKDTRNFYAALGYKLGFVNGASSGRFDPKSPVTREQMALILYNAIGKAGIREQMKLASVPAFADEDRIAGWSREAVGAMAASGLMQGSIQADLVYFRPKGAATVEEAAVIVNRIREQYGAIRASSEEELLEAVKRGYVPVATGGRLGEIYRAAQQALQHIVEPGMSDYEKELAIHDYLVLHTAYDEANYKQGTVPDDSYSAYGALVKGIAVCQGYANAANLLLNMSGIEAHIVTGTVGGEPHAWNKIRLEGDYYNVDVTWDDPVPDKQGRVYYGYFNVTDDELRQDHEWVDNGLPAALGTMYNYYRHNQLLAEDPLQFEAKVEEAIARRELSLTVKRTYMSTKDIEPLKAPVFRTGAVQAFECTFGSGGVVTLTFRYR
ncbi:transglutaminase domain-containing protein [Paenibacillus aurantiacus]|uniref:Transglutaminase domain-containing protein n=1 Tax=Paenibacillus aurantiacus TaxID=1936118 RepID=A0ABV5KP35_9BACL